MRYALTAFVVWFCLAISTVLVSRLDNLAFHDAIAVVAFAGVGIILTEIFYAMWKGKD